MSVEDRIKEVEEAIEELESFQAKFEAEYPDDLCSKMEIARTIERNREILCAYKGEKYVRKWVGETPCD